MKLRSLTLGGVLWALAACSSSGGGGEGKTFAEAQAIRLKLADIIAADPRFADPTPLTHDDYAALAAKLRAVPGVEVAAFAGDALGSISVKIEGGGVFEWRHINDDSREAFGFPEGFDFSQLDDRTANVAAGVPQVVNGLRKVAASGTYATRFNDTSGTGKTNIDFVADRPVSCPVEGKIAIVDFYYSEEQEKHELYTDPVSPFVVDGMEIWKRLALMGEQAGFQVTIYKDNEVNAGNFVSKLKDAAYVITNGHGTRPAVFNFDRTGEAMVSLVTSEDFDSNHEKLLENGTSYFDAWKMGWLNEGLTDHTVRWTPRLIEAEYEPSVPQVWFMNECSALLPVFWGWELDDETGWTFRKSAVGRVFNFGHALLQKGVKGVLGYAANAGWLVIPHHLMAFFRRQFGGYFAGDLPPSPHNFWPTCMSVQTYFRSATNPYSPALFSQLERTSYFTYYMVDEPIFLRKVCQGTPTIPQAYMQDLLLQLGTPATEFKWCWDQYWRVQFPLWG